jgi:hypothetical protein
MKRILVASALLLVAACAIDRALLPPALRSSGPWAHSYPLNPTCSSADPNPAKDFAWQDSTVGGGPSTVNQYACGATIHVSVSNQSAVTATRLAAAEAIWNNGLSATTYGLPVFGASGAGTYQLTITETGTGNFVCGQTSTGANRTITIAHFTSSTGCSDMGLVSVSTSNDGQVEALVAHELGHAFGFSKHLGSSSDTIVHSCVMVVQTTMNGTVCEHERQIVYFEYKLQGNDPNVAKVFMYGIDVDPSLALNVSSSGWVHANHLLIQDYNSGNFEVPLTSGDSVMWSVSGSSFSLSNATKDSIKVTSSATGGPGNTILQADIPDGDTLTYNIAWPFNAGGSGQTTLSFIPPAGPPTSLAKGTITSTTAPLTWTNGDGSAQTEVEDRLSFGFGSWGVVSTQSPGVTGYTISGLTPCNSYDVEVVHLRNGIESTGDSLVNGHLPLGVNTPAASGVCAPSNFTIAGCTDSTEGTKTYLYVGLTWIRHEFSAGSTTEIASSPTNDTTIATVIVSVPSSTTSAVVGPYLESGTYFEYFWVRHKTSGGSTSRWLAMDDNPIEPKFGCVQ